MGFVSLFNRCFGKRSTTIRKKPAAHFRPSLEMLEHRLTPTTINVSTYTDAALRAAISTAVTDSASNNPVTIDFTNGPGTVLLTGGVLDLNEGSGTGLITINGTNQNIAINANAASGVLEVDSGGQVAINNLTIEGGNNSANGGGVDNSGTLTVSDSTISGNFAGNNGGGIENAGTLMVSDSTLSGNSANNNGGGIWNDGTLTVSGCTVSSNTASLNPTSVYDTGVYGDGGGIGSDGQLTLTNSTLTGNSAGNGAGLGESGSGVATVTYCTITMNNCPGGAVALLDGDNTLTMQSTIDAGNTYRNPNPDIWNGGTFVDNGYNIGGAALQGLGQPSTDVFTDDPDLAPLGNYGGPTQTMPPLAGSLALGAGSYPGAPLWSVTFVYVEAPSAPTLIGYNASDLGTDQRGEPRSVDGTVDIGAVESGSNPPTLEALFAQNLAPSNPISVQASSSSEADAVIDAVNQLPSYSTPVTVTLNLTAGSSIGDVVASPPPGVTLVINGLPGGTDTIVGNSPALTVSSGNVIVTGMTLTTATDAPTILVTGGSLELRNDDIESSTGFADAAISVSGGTVDAGTAGDPGDNIFDINHAGAVWFANTTSNPIVAVGDTLEINGVATDANATLQVSDSADAGQQYSGSDNPTDTNGLISLRSAIAAANLDANAGASDTITFAPNLNGTTLTLTQGDLELTAGTGTTTTIDGGGKITISANDSDGVFAVDAGAQAVVTGLAITGGTGYGIFSNGTLTVSDSTIFGNFGPGIDVNTGMVTVSNSTLSDNSTNNLGGGIDNNGTLTVSSSTFFGNFAQNFGGGIFNQGTLTVSNSTLSGNSADYGGGISNYGRFGNPPLTLQNTIVAGNTATSDPDIYGSITTDLGNNLLGTALNPILTRSSSAIGPGDVFNDHPGLAPLGNYGGPTQTMALLPGSPAIGAGSNPLDLATDQRGEPRVVNGTVDIGAFESQIFTTTTANAVIALFSTASQHIALGASVVSSSGVGVVNEGTVTFSVFNSAGTIQIGNAVTSGTISDDASAVFTIPANTATGAYQIHAVYNPGPDFLGSSDNSQTLTVILTPTTTQSTTVTTAYSTSAQTLILTGNVIGTGGLVNGGTVTFIVANSATVLAMVTSPGQVVNGTDTASFILPAGAAPQTFTITTAYSGNAIFAPSANFSGSLTVTKATPPAITWSSPANITYGTPLTGTQLDAADSMAGTFKYSPASGTVLNGGNNQTLMATFTPTNATDYSSTSKSVTINVLKATPLPTLTAVSLTYGTALANSQLGGTATFVVNGTKVNVPGTYVYTSAAGTVLTASSTAYTEAVTFTPTDTTDYLPVSKNVSVTVGKAVPLASVNPVSLTYGTALAKSQLSGTATFVVNGTSVNVPGACSYTSVAGTVLKASPTAYTETVTFAPTNTTDYASATTNVMVTVGKATPIVSVTAVSLTYGTALANSQLGGTATFVVNGTSVNVPGTYSYTSAANAVLAASSSAYTETVTFTPTDTTDYALPANLAVQVTVGQAQLTLTPVTITYGTALASTQLSGTFVVNGTKVNVPGTYSYTSATGTVLAASSTAYSEGVTVAPTDTTDYLPVSKNVSVTVGKAAPHVSVNPVSLTYGTALADTQLSGTATFVVNGTSVNVPGAYSYTTSATGTVLNASSTPFTETVTFAPTNTTDYASVTTNVMVSVGKATPNLNPVNLTYGTVLANSQLTASFVVNGTTVNVPGTGYTSLAGTVPIANTAEEVAFTPADTTDYTSVLTYVMVIVAKATPQVSVNPVSLGYNTPLANSQLSGTATSMFGGLSVNVPGIFAYTKAEKGTVLGVNSNSYTETVTFTPTDATDYNSATANVTVTVGQPNVSVNQITLTYGTALANSQLSGTATFDASGTMVNVPGIYSYAVVVIRGPGGSEYLTEAGKVLDASSLAYALKVLFVPTNTTDYAAVTTIVGVVVDKAIPSVSFNPVNLTYGTALANSQLTGTATFGTHYVFFAGYLPTYVPGTFSYGSAEGVVLHASSSAYTLPVTFTPTDAADYASVSGNITVTVGKATPNVSVNRVSFSSPTALANSQLTGTATVAGMNVPGTFTYQRAAFLYASSTEAVTFTPTDTTDYASVGVYVTVTVVQPTYGPDYYVILEPVPDAYQVEYQYAVGNYTSRTIIVTFTLIGSTGPTSYTVPPDLDNSPPGYTPVGPVYQGYPFQSDHNPPPPSAVWAS